MGHPGAPNHDHHRSVWFAHHDINGETFWADQTKTSIRQANWLCYEEADDHALMAVDLHWLNGNREAAMRQRLITTLRPLSDGAYSLELQSTFQPATKGDDVELGKTNFQNMPKGVLFKAGWDYVWIRMVQLFKTIPDDNFENWVVKRFGRTLYEIFFGTYTAKAWKMPCSEISADWASQRISQANLWDTIKKTLRPPKGGEVRSLVSEFWYPAFGGIGQIGRKYGEKLVAMGANLHLESPLERIEIEDGKAKRVVWTHQGQEHSTECDEVINTVPLPRMLEAFAPGIGDNVKTAIGNLDYSCIVFVYLEVKNPSVSPDHWVYLPEGHLTIHRISEFKNFSDDCAPGDSTVVCCEITCREGDELWNLDIEGATEIAIRDLETVGLIEPNTATGIDMHKLKYAYPIYDLTYKENLDTLKKEAKKVRNLHTTGRQGLYRYNNMDHSIAMGRRIAKTIAKGADARADEVAAGQEYFG